MVSLISSIEIVRRSVWMVLRIEYEQVSNASGFRALLWVPSKLHMMDVTGVGVSNRERRASTRIGLRASLLGRPKGFGGA